MFNFAKLSSTISTNIKENKVIFGEFIFRDGKGCHHGRFPSLVIQGFFEDCYHLYRYKCDSVFIYHNEAYVIEDDNGDYHLVSWDSENFPKGKWVEHGNILDPSLRFLFLGFEKFDTFSEFGESVLDNGETIKQLFDRIIENFHEEISSDEILNEYAWDHENISNNPDWFLSLFKLVYGERNYQDISEEEECMFDNYLLLYLFKEHNLRIL